MRTWRYKTDEAGRPRRFLSHREAAWWAASRVGAFFGTASLFDIARMVYGAITSPAERWASVMLVVMLAVLWVSVSAVVYLSGGVMSRAERERRESEEAPLH